MELSALSENIVSVPYKRGNETIELQVNIDAFTPEFFRLQKARAEEKFKEFQREVLRLKKEEQAKTRPKKLTKAQKAELEFEQAAQLTFTRLEQRAQEAEAERQSFAELLSSNVLKGWDVTENGIPVEPSKEVLMRLPPRGLEELWYVCVKASQTVKKRVDEETEETSENMLSGSKGLHVVGQAG